MIVDDDLTKTLNLSRTSPGFVLKQIGADGTLEVIQMGTIPNDDDIF